MKNTLAQFHFMLTRQIIGFFKQKSDSKRELDRPLGQLLHSPEKELTGSERFDTVARL
ncbi:MAG: hypothetical protein F7O42_02320 [Opitutae bacterium]|nr:hypothetical protein [Opitutae bacterium]